MVLYIDDGDDEEDEEVAHSSEAVVMYSDKL